MAVAERIAEAQGKGGEAYSEKGKRNPIREDTNAILTALVLAKQPQVIVEIGTAYGASAMCMAQGLLTGGHIYTYELSEDVAEEVNRVVEGEELPITCIAGRFEEVYRNPSDQVDMLFLDHEKGLYLDHFKLILPDLAPGALVVADNVIDRAEECKAFLKYMHEHYNPVIVQTECGLLVATV